MNITMVKFAVCKVVFLMLLMPCLVKAQVDVNQATTSFEEVSKYPQFKFKGLFQARFLGSLSDNVDVLGVHNSAGEVTKTSFDVKRMRVGLNTKLSKETEVVLLVNLADFKSDPKNKVLENAYAKYTFSNYFAVTGGQFRPAFGMEELVPVDVIKSFDFSNQYYEFGKNGWTSFQIGISATGSFDLGVVPFSYAVSVLNGTGRNQEKDKDSGKLYSTRWVFGLSKRHKINLGLNGGMGKVFNQDVFALGVDITSDFKISEQFTFDLDVEYKQGTNHNLYFSLSEDNRTNSADYYQMRGYYIMPNLRYSIDYKKLTSLEFSCRYEFFDTNFKLNSNVRQTYTPMISLEFGKAYTGRIQLGFQIDRYDKNIPNTSMYKGDLFIVQFQTRL